ncbi:hypothetical protein Focb16_v005928 [Fusarium oxysporum f. sp. cubense]|uniref:Uncharacterized protein n=1 Tax=Fusarium oxysporum f. sp. cubense TaxID=61366 RepID=A0A559LJW5_FUSOC|nr:hypothetical protein Focb16_v005928 [Fusarium oxysporum f. sp. cubense]
MGLRNWFRSGRLWNGAADKGNGGADKSAAFPDFDSSPDIGTKTAANMAVDSAASFSISTPVHPNKQSTPDSAPIPYSIATQPHSVQMLWAVFTSGLTIGKEHGLPSAFNVLRHRRFQVWIDENSKLPLATKHSIRLMVLILHLLGRAMDSDMEFFFMGYSNSDSKDLDQDEARKSKALDELWKTQNWNEAKSFVERSKDLQEMGLKDWIKRAEEQGSWVAGQQGEGFAETSQEKFTRLLDHIRKLKVPYWRGFHQRDLEQDDLRVNCINATKESQKQPRSLSNVRFTLERATAHYQRQIKSQDTTPTTVLLLTGSPMQNNEVQLVIKQQTASHSKGEGGGFSIGIMAWTKWMDALGKSSFRILDEAFRGSQDINDVTEVDDDLLLKKGPSSALLLKVLNADNPAVDKMNLRKADLMYGKDNLLEPEETKLVMPLPEDVARALGQYKEPEVDDDDAGEVPFAPTSVDGGPFGDSKSVPTAI